MVAPIGKAPADGRPIVAWAHGTTGTAQSCGPSQVLNPAVSLNDGVLIVGVGVLLLLIIEAEIQIRLRFRSI